PSGVPIDVKLTKDGFEQSKREVALDANTPTKLALELKKGSVVVEVSVAPGDVATTMTLDGKPISGPRIEGVASGISHRLVVSAPGYVDAAVTFTGSALETKHVDVTLEK